MPDNAWDVASVPDKDDILHAYAGFYAGGGTPTITFGMDRYANNGEANVGFWFFQNNDRPEQQRHVHRDADRRRPVRRQRVQQRRRRVGHRRPRMERLRAVVRRHRHDPRVRPRRRRPERVRPGQHRADDRSLAVHAQAGCRGTFPTASFFEGGVNLDAVFGAGDIPCFSSFMAETRSSTTPQAELKNFVLGNFDTCGDVTIIKNAVPNSAQDFNFNSEFGADFQLDDDGNATLSNTKVYEDVNPGTYTISEDAVDGWDLTNIDCDETVDENSDVDIGAGSVDIVVDPTESVTCTFTNTKRGSITIRKLTSPAGAAGDFDFGFGGVPDAQDPGTVAARPWRDAHDQQPRPGRVHRDRGRAAGAVLARRHLVRRPRLQRRQRLAHRDVRPGSG